MRGDVPAVALRLMEQLPVREHRAEPEVIKPLFTPKPKIRVGRKKRVTGAGRGGANKRAIRIGGRQFESIRQAHKELNIGHTRLSKMLADGRAQYITEKG